MRVAEEPTAKQVPLVWEGIENVPITFTNEILLQAGQYGEFLLTFGQSAPPAILGETEEERVKKLERVSSVPVNPIARFALTPTTLVQLSTLLQMVLANYQQPGLNE